MNATIDTNEVKSKLQKFGPIALLIALLFGGGYATGRFTAPQKVVTQIKTVTQTQDKIVYQTQTQIQVVHDVDVQHDIQIKTVTVEAKDGTKTTTTTEADHSKSEAQVKAAETEATQKAETKTVYQTQTITKTVEREKPQWSLALQPGFSLGTSQYNLLSAIPVPRLMANVVVERRILGPVFVGVWASTKLDGGLSLRLEF